MKTSKQLKEERASLITEQDSLVASAKAENRNLNQDEETTFDDLQSRITAFNDQIKRAEQIEANEKRAAAAAGIPVNLSEEREAAKMLKNYNLHAAIRTQLRNGKMEGVEAEFHQDLLKETQRMGLKTQGVLIPEASRYVKRATSQTVTQDSGGYGAKLVYDDFGGVITELTPNPTLRKIGATYLGGLSGDLVFTTDDGGIAATWEGEVDTVSNTKTAYGQKRMSPKRLSATVGISLQNLMQSSIDLQSYTAGRIRLKNELAIDTAGINGAGTGNVPEGILNATGTGSVVGGTNGLAPTRDHLVDLVTAVGSANAIEDEGKLAYLINYVTRGQLQKTKHNAGDANYLMDNNNMLNGYSAYVSNLVPSNLDKGTSTGVCSAGIFGDFSNLLIGQWGFYDVVVDEITQKKSGIIEITSNQFLDVLLRHPAAFAVVKDWLTA